MTFSQKIDRMLCTYSSVVVYCVGIQYTLMGRKYIYIPLIQMTHALAENLVFWLLG